MDFMCPTLRMDGQSGGTGVSLLAPRSEVSAPGRSIVRGVVQPDVDAGYNRKILRYSGDDEEFGVLRKERETFFHHAAPNRGVGQTAQA
jgi:hypothetical protein